MYLAEEQFHLDFYHKHAFENFAFGDIFIKVCKVNKFKHYSQIIFPRESPLLHVPMLIACSHAMSTTFELRRGAIDNR